MEFVLKKEYHHESEKFEAYLDQKKEEGLDKQLIYLSKETNVPS